MNIWDFFKSSKAKVKFKQLHGARVILPKSREVKYSPAERKAAFKELNSALHKDFGKEGMNFHPDFTWPTQIWENNLFIVGSSGSGKTQVLKRVFDEVRKVGSDGFLPKIGTPLKKKPGFVLYDIKGDFTEYYAGEPDVALLGDWDKRSVVLDIGKDIKSAREISLFSSIFYPAPANESGNSKFFREISIKIIETVLKTLIVERGEKWDWTNLYVELVSINDNVDKLISLAREIESALQQEDEEGKISKNETIENIKVSLISVIDTMGTFAIPLLSKSINYRKISLTEFLENKTHYRTLILKDNATFKKVSGPYFTFILSFLTTKIMDMDDTSEKRLFLGLDEAGQLPKIPNFISNLMIFRSKGCVIIYGIQDINQIRTQYGDKGMITFLGAFNTRLYGRISEAKEAEDLVKALGVSEFEERKYSRGKSSGRKGSKNENESVNIIKKDNMLPSHLTEIPSGGKLGALVRFWLKISGIPVILVDWEIKAFEKKYLNTVPAVWIEKNVLNFDFKTYESRENLKKYNKKKQKEFQKEQYQKFCEDIKAEKVIDNKNRSEMKDSNDLLEHELLEDFEVEKSIDKPQKKSVKKKKTLKKLEM